MSTFPRVVVAGCLVTLFAPRANAQTKIVALDADVETTYTFPNGQEITNRGHLYRSSAGQVREDSALGSIITDVSNGTVTLLVSETKEARIITISPERRTSLRRELPVIEPFAEAIIDGHPIAKVRTKGPKGENQELWTAKDLGIVTWSRVESAKLTMTRALLNVGVAEPDQSVFQIPSDYTVIEQSFPLEMITSVSPYGATRAANGNNLGQVVVVPDPSLAPAGRRP